MSTNYYAIVTLPTMHDEEEDRIFRFHIGKTGGGTSVRGDQFASFREMVTYLKHTTAKILDEYGVELTLTELIERFERYALEQRRSQHDWVRKEAQGNGSQSAWARAHVDEYWLDAEGYSICRGAFS